MDRYSFIAVDLHHLLLAGIPGALRLSPGVLLLTLTGACALDSDLRITFLTHGLDGSARASQAFKELAASVSPRSSRRLPPWTARSLSMRSTLIAIDGDAAGATYREIARIIFGAEYTDAVWRKNQSPRTAYATPSSAAAP